MFSARHSNRRTVAVTVVDGLYQEDVANVLAVEPAVQPDVSKPEDTSTQAPMSLYACIVEIA